MSVYHCLYPGQPPRADARNGLHNGLHPSPHDIHAQLSLLIPSHNHPNHRPVQSYNSITVVTFKQFSVSLLCPLTIADFLDNCLKLKNNHAFINLTPTII